MKRVIALIVIVVFVSGVFCKAVLAQESKDSKVFDLSTVLAEMDREDLEWLVIELLADNLDISPEEVLENPKEVVGLFERMEMEGNDALAESTVRSLSVAAETFATTSENMNVYPQSIEDLTEADEPYLSEGYCGETIEGFKYDCSFSSEGYKFVATPVEMGVTGSAIYVIRTGGIPTLEKQTQLEKIE